MRCPATIATPAREARPGLTWDEAADLIVCTCELMVVNVETSRRFQIAPYGQKIRQGISAAFAQLRGQLTPQQRMKEMQAQAIRAGSNSRNRGIERGQSRWYVGTMGLPGKECVIVATRAEWFQAERHPAIESVAQVLVEKCAPTP